MKKMVLPVRTRVRVAQGARSFRGSDTTRIDCPNCARPKNCSKCKRWKIWLRRR